MLWGPPFISVESREETKGGEPALVSPKLDGAVGAGASECLGVCAGWGQAQGHQKVTEFLQSLEHLHLLK